MGTQRTSTKDIMQAIEAQTASLEALIQVLSGTQAHVAPEPPRHVIVDNIPVLQPEVEVAPLVKVTAPSNVKVDAAYDKRVSFKAQGHANKIGVAVTKYARKNRAGETKLAYCVADRYVDVKAKDRGVIGSICTYKPTV